jgi:hypothetical protein
MAGNGGTFKKLQQILIKLFFSFAVHVIIILFWDGSRSNDRTFVHQQVSLGVGGRKK